MYLIAMFRFITAFSIFTLVASEQAGRRRRSLYHQKPCGPGQHSILSKTKQRVLGCEDCPANTYRADEKHSQENCMACPAGRISNDNKSLCIGEICLAGKYGTAGSNICNECNIGEYSEKGAFNCKKCESGRYNTSPGNNNCLGEKCHPGKFGLIGQTKESATMCSTCQNGKWSSEGLAECISCPDGKYSNEGAASCQDHERCHSDSYYTYTPSNKNRNIDCEKCIYSSTIYTIGFFFNCFVVCSIFITILYSCNTNGWMVFLTIAPIVCIIVLVRCSNNPNDYSAIISIIVNALCVMPLFLNLCRYINKNLKKYASPKQEGGVV